MLEGPTINFGGNTFDFNRFYLLRGANPKEPFGTEGSTHPSMRLASCREESCLGRLIR